MKGSRSVERFYRIALLCGALPLIVGIGIYILWLVTEWDPLMVAGIFTIWGGLACVAIGFVCAAIYAVKLRATGASPSPIARRVAKPLGLMLLNLPVALIIFSLAWTTITRYELRLTNDSDAVIARFGMVAPGVEEVFDNVRPGESRSVGVHFEGDGSFKYEAEIGGVASAGLIEGYVTHNLGGEMSAVYDGVEFHFERTWD